MSSKLTLKTIKEKCGMVSFKRGEVFYRQKHVVVVPIKEGHWEAIVKGGEAFHVTIKRDKDGKYHGCCSCPTLASIDHDCQHIAAVLITIFSEHQEFPLDPSEDPERQAIPLVPSQSPAKPIDDFNGIFDREKVRPLGYQRHFETRQLVDVEIFCHGLSIENGKHVLAIELEVNAIPVSNIHQFLKEIIEGRPFKLSPSFVFDPNLHCFSEELEKIFLQLISVVRDGRLMGGQKANNNRAKLSAHLLVIPPSYWKRLFGKLIELSNVSLIYGDQRYKGLSVCEEKLPIQFVITKSVNGHALLKIQERTTLMVFKDYHLVLADGKMTPLDAEDCDRLWTLLKIQKATGVNPIRVPEDRATFLKGNVIAALQRLGEVQITDERDHQTHKPTPLKAKLYLDRIRNRLLAGLEFHYEQVVIQPLEKREVPKGVNVIRDIEKEERILQLMADSQFTETEGGYYLHNEELEFTFLTQILPHLQKHVQVYATTAVRNRVSKGAFRPQVRVRVKKDRMNWLEFKFEMTGISNDEVRDVLQALEEKRKFYRLRNDTLLSLETQEFDDVRRFLQKPEITNKDLLMGLELPMHSSLKLLDTVQSADVFQLEASLTNALKALENPPTDRFEVPKQFDAILRPYQKQGFQWLKTLAELGFGGILADDMGLGKTVQSIAFIVSVLEDLRKENRSVLIVSPSSLTYNWLREFKQFAPEVRVMIVDGSPKERRQLLKEMGQHDVVITSYPLLRKDISTYEKDSFHTLFFDEAQAFKNPISQTAKAVKRLQADHRFALTGTPLENALEELWSIFHVVFPELLLGLKAFSMLSHKKIANRIRPFMLRRMKKDVLLELPKKKATIEVVELLPEQKKLYAAYLAKLRHDTLKHLDKETKHKNRIRILAGITRLRQICCHPGLFVEGYKGRSAKLNQLLTLLTQAKHAGRRVLIFSQFTKMLELISHELVDRGQPFFYLDGETPNEERVDLCDRFNKGERDLFLISLKAGGTGLNLTGADTVILYDTWWNPAVEEQASDRAHRMGQQKEVQVIKLITQGSIEEKMNDLQDKKRALIDEMINSEGKGTVTLTDEDIQELVMVE